jgi:hypothetical protein
MTGPLKWKSQSSISTSFISVDSPNHRLKPVSGLGMVVHAYNPNYLGGTGRKIMVRGQTRQKYKFLSEK